MQSHNKWWSSLPQQLHCRFTSQTILQWWINSQCLCEYSLISQLLLCVVWAGFKHCHVSYDFPMHSTINNTWSGKQFICSYLMIENPASLSPVCSVYNMNSAEVWDLFRCSHSCNRTKAGCCILSIVAVHGWWFWFVIQLSDHHVATQFWGSNLYEIENCSTISSLLNNHVL